MQQLTNINDIYKTTYNLDNVIYNNKKVLHMNKAELVRICKDYNFSSFLTLSQNQVKLKKNLKELNIFTIGMSLAPYSLGNKLDICLNASLECKKNCVIWNSGNPAYIDAKQNAMIKRKDLLKDNPSLFLAIFLRYIELYTSYCISKNLLLSIRFNIASDIEYENINIVYKNNTNSFSNIADSLIQKTKMNKKLKFKLSAYDYTKNFNRKDNPKYKIVYSVNDNDNTKIEKAIKNKLSLAMVFDTKRNKPLPKTYTINNKVFKVIDGDLHDYLPLQQKQVIIGLRFKYNAKDNKQKRENKLNKAILQGFVKIANKDIKVI